MFLYREKPIIAGSFNLLLYNLSERIIAIIRISCDLKHKLFINLNLENNQTREKKINKKNKQILY